MKAGLAIGIGYGFLAIFFTFVGASGITIPWSITVIFAGAISVSGFLDASDCRRN